MLGEKSGSSRNDDINKHKDMSSKQNPSQEHVDGGLWGQAKYQVFASASLLPSLSLPFLVTSSPCRKVVSSRDRG